MGSAFLLKHLLCASHEFFVISKGDMMDQFQHIYVRRSLCCLLYGFVMCFFVCERVTVASENCKKKLA